MTSDIQTTTKARKLRIFDSPNSKKTEIINEIKPIKYDISGYIHDTSYDKKDKKKLLLIRNISGVMTVIKKAKITGKTDKVKYNNHTFLFDISKPLYRSRNTWVYGLDVDNGQITLTGTESKVSSELIDMILNRHVIKDLVSGLEPVKLKDMLIFILLSLITGITTGILIGQSI